jgi:hypothetical protein
MIKTTSMIFNTEMVLALLVGNKTQTRRRVSDWQLPGKTSDDTAGLEYMSTAVRGRWGFGVFGATAEEAMNNYNGEYNCENPYGRAGALIYVRETFGFSENHFNDIAGQYCIEYKADGGCSLINPTTDNNDYMANLVLKKGNTPSIHMPRWASRLTLKINSVRVERIQDISEDDAWAEGVDRDCVLKIPTSDAASAEFSRLWENLYPDRWDKHDWVWVIDFEVIHKNIDRVLEEMEQAA